MKDRNLKQRDHTALKAYRKFKNFIVGKEHPCMMAQTVFKMDEVTLRTYDKMGTPQTTLQLLTDIKDYLNTYDFQDNSFETFIAVFPNTQVADEEEFENLLWEQLQKIHQQDAAPWDPSVQSNPNHPNFSFSVAGRAFYIVGMHPKSSRVARRAPYPTMVFNLHQQFEKLREMGVYDRVRDTIRQRDRDLQGSVNPMLEDFGKQSEARQYSGRKVNPGWECPFHFEKK